MANLTTASRRTPQQRPAAHLAAFLSVTPGPPLLRIFSWSVALGPCLSLAYELAVLRAAEISLPGEMVDFRGDIHPDDGIAFADEVRWGRLAFCLGKCRGPNKRSAYGQRVINFEIIVAPLIGGVEEAQACWFRLKSPPTTAKQPFLKATTKHKERDHDRSP